MPRANIPFGCQVQAGQGSSDLSFRPGNQSRWSVNPQANLQYGSQDLAGQGSSGLSFGSSNSMNNSNATQGNQSRWSINPQANLQHGRQILAGQDSSGLVVRNGVSGSGLAFRPGNSTNNSDATRGNQASLRLNPRANLEHGSQGLAGQGSSGFAFRPGSSTNNLDATRGSQVSYSMHPPANVQYHSQGLAGRGNGFIDKSGVAASGLAFKAGSSVINSASSSSNPRANLQWNSQAPAGPASTRIDHLEPLGISPEANMQQQTKQPTRTSSRLAARAAKGLTRPSNADSYPAMRTKGKTNAARRIQNTQPSMDSQSGRLAKHQIEKFPVNTLSKDKYVTSSTSQSKRIKSPHAAVTKGKATTTVSAHTAPSNRFLTTWGFKKTRSSLSEMEVDEEEVVAVEEEAVHDPLSYHIKWNVSDTFADPELRPIGERCQLCHLDLMFSQGVPPSYSDDPAIHAVLPCGHCFHYSCLVSIYGKPEPSQTPTCFACSVQ